ncbi:hypothetical protein E6R18_24565 [Streptomyces sp. A1277]|nr:hypothetical protein E6R18_24565 [Streptomyces sp. A1277]
MPSSPRWPTATPQRAGRPLPSGCRLHYEDLDPLDLAARAEVALQLVHGETGLTTADLLEPVGQGSAGARAARSA